ncbi:hypothetical protein HanPI659440_Chr02g0044231 [Helianthus annuus]|nr:hypothetical protein HanPI659440_Chr02g0044231 [Helianthus annuus]
MCPATAVQRARASITFVILGFGDLLFCSQATWIEHLLCFMTIRVWSMRFRWKMPPVMLIGSVGLLLHNYFCLKMKCGGLKE